MCVVHRHGCQKQKLILLMTLPIDWLTVLNQEQGRARHSQLQAMAGPGGAASFASNIWTWGCTHLLLLRTLSWLIDPECGFWFTTHHWTLSLAIHAGLIFFLQDNVPEMFQAYLF